MKKIICSIIILIFLRLNAENNTIKNKHTQNIFLCSKDNGILSVDFHLNSYEIKDIQKNNLHFKRIAIANEKIISKNGNVELPRLARLIAIENQGNPYVKLIHSEKETLKNIAVFPSQFQNLKNTNDFDINSNLYDKIVHLGKPAILTNYRVASLNISPFQYNPIKKELTIYKNIKFEILYGFAKETINPKQNTGYRSKAFESIYSSSILNYELYNDRFSEYQKPCLLIIRKEAIPADYLSNFINWKHRKGFKVISVTAEQDIGGDGVDEIKNYIHNAYDNWDPPPEYICLIGEGQDNDERSIRGKYYQDENGHPYRSDQYYAMIDGDDFLPDIIIGRLPINTIEQQQIIMNKIINYETSYNQSDNWIQNVYLVSDPRYYETGNYIQSKVTTNRYIESIIPNENQNYNVDFKIYPDESSTSSNIINKINDGISFYNFLGDMHFGGINSYNINNLHNIDKLPFISAITCGTGYFCHNGHSSWGLARIMLQAGTAINPKGTIGFIGSSDNYTKSIYNNYFSAGISSGIFNDHVYTFGGALIKGQINLFTAFEQDATSTDINNVQRTILWNNLWGDPTIELWTDIPKEMNVIHSATKILGDNYIEVNVTNSENEPLNNVLVCLLQQIDSGEDEIFTTNYTDENGYTLIPYNTTTPGNVLVTSVKHNYRPYLGSFNIESEESSVNYFDTIIEDNNNGNGDNHANPGEQIGLAIVLKNFGNSTSNNVIAEMTTENPYINIFNSIANYGNISPGTTALPDSNYILSIAPNIPNEDIDFNIIIHDNNNNYSGFFTLPITGYDINFIQCNGNINPDNTPYDFSISLQNIGEISTPNLYTKLNSNNSELTIIDEYGNYDSINPMQILSTNDMFRASANTSIIAGTTLNLILNIYLDAAHQTLFKNINIPLTIGTPNVTSPLGPDSYGYICYDDGDIGYNDRPEYDWIEINNIGTPLSEINQEPGPDDLGAYNQIINLPFNFKFYGIEYNDYLTVSSAGWISFGIHEEESFYNSPLPGVLGPSPMIAAFWTELHYINGISNASYFYNEELHQFIIEWNKFKQNYSNNEETFQIILFDPIYYPLLSSDGLIKIQYKTISNENALAPNASIGLEDHTQSIGLQYTYSNLYPIAAKEIENEMAVLFTTNPPENLNSFESDNIHLMPITLSNYPNPFNPSTTISFDLAKLSKDTKITIYNLKGEKIKELEAKSEKLGVNTIVWDGKNDNNKKVASGVYLYQLKQNGKTVATKKMLMVK